MPRRRWRKAVSPVPSVERPADLAAGLRPALAKRKKAELVDLILELAGEDRRLLRQLTARFDVWADAEALATATRQAIGDATHFDKRDINRNFTYDYAAYEEVQRNLRRLVESRQLASAMQLSLELMEAGSYQVEMSDEGLMTQDIEDCLSAVIAGLEAGDLPAADIVAWCTAMQAADRLGFIAETPLQSLRRRFSATDAK